MPTRLDEIKFGATPQSTELARIWMSRCREEHVTCRFKSAQFTPTRLVKIEGEEHTLFVPASGDRLIYATLSHCWNEQSSLRLLSHKLESLQLDIPTQEMSKSFKDAIKIATTPGYTIIWIDSLCIIQDNSEDWKKEAGHMADVYGCSAINITPYQPSIRSGAIFHIKCAWQIIWEQGQITTYIWRSE